MLAPLLILLAFVLVIAGAVYLTKRLTTPKPRPPIGGGGGVPDAPRDGDKQS